MPRIPTRLDPRSPAFGENAAHHRALAADLRKQVAAVAEGGGADAQKKHVARGKLLPRERVRALLDPGFSCPSSLHAEERRIEPLEEMVLHQLRVFDVEVRPGVEHVGVDVVAADADDAGVDRHSDPGSTISPATAAAPAT